MEPTESTTREAPPRASAGPFLPSSHSLDGPLRPQTTAQVATLLPFGVEPHPARGTGWQAALEGWPALRPRWAGVPGPPQPALRVSAPATPPSSHPPIPHPPCILPCSTSQAPKPVITAHERGKVKKMRLASKPRADSLPNHLKEHCAESATLGPRALLRGVPLHRGKGSAGWGVVVGMGRGEGTAPARQG